MTPLPNGLASAVAAIVGVPRPDVGTEDELDEWLGSHHLGRVPIAGAATFSWAGHWIAVTTADRALRMFGQPSAPLDTALAPDEAIVAGYVIAPRDLRLEVTATRREGIVEGIYIAAEKAGPMEAHQRVAVTAGVGLDGDRYARGEGTFSSPGSSGRNITLIDADALEAAGVVPELSRRNIITRGIDLDGAIGRDFRIGSVRCHGQRRAEPCAHLQRLAGPGILRALVHRGGLRADILDDGILTVGDVVVIEPD